MYNVYLGTTLLPIAPSKMQIGIDGKNDTVNLINEGDVNILKKPGLTTVEFEVLLPNVKYPFANYDNGFQMAEHYLNVLEGFMNGGKPFQFIVSRKKPNGNGLFGTNLKVSLEGYTIKEDAKNGLDVMVSIKLKQYREYGTKTMVIAKKKTAGVKVSRDASNSPAPGTTQTYTVKSGDSLWKIAKQYYGNGGQYTKIFNANKDKIKNPSLIYPGQVLTIPA